MSRHRKILLWGLIGIITLWLPTAWILASGLVLTKPLEKADAIYILSGSADHIERAEEAAQLFRDKKASKILLTDDKLQGGWNNELERNPYFVERTRWLLIDGGVPAAAIEILPDEINGTEDEANAVLKTMCGEAESSVLLVTSTYHTRRTFLIFESVVGSCDKKIELGISHPRSGLTGYNKFFWWMKPKLATNVASEYIKIIAMYF